MFICSSGVHHAQHNWIPIHNVISSCRNYHLECHGLSCLAVRLNDRFSSLSTFSFSRRNNSLFAAAAISSLSACILIFLLWLLLCALSLFLAFLNSAFTLRSSLSSFAILLTRPQTGPLSSDRNGRMYRACIGAGRNELIRSSLVQFLLDKPELTTGTSLPVHADADIDLSRTIRSGFR